MATIGSGEFGGRATSGADEFGSRTSSTLLGIGTNNASVASGQDDNNAAGTGGIAMHSAKESAVQTFLAMLGIGTKVPVSKNITCTSSSQDESEKSGFAASGQKDGAKRRSRITKLPEEECDEACRSSKLEEEDEETSRKH